ncbi:MAG: hypothetical protein AVDCRST_MAG67-4123 [uncultured Solirubrobacteraceae bacterium]|uniref:Uncharacterized protein n=1 Tax=uncultured Solirubrobacteraceae bacterium TaxID=1162706 RepID=A0A6J4TSS0_9ACTN|nr:MAG: hypothetical protein AVDCRST_MAG67-4123 [uncultured Solirubrobacteraceae bacterium]
MTTTPCPSTRQDTLCDEDASSSSAASASASGTCLTRPAARPRIDAHSRELRPCRQRPIKALRWMVDREEVRAAQRVVGQAIIDVQSRPRR